MPIFVIKLNFDEERKVALNKPIIFVSQFIISLHHKFDCWHPFQYFHKELLHASLFGAKGGGGAI